ncbi:HNH endonuclease [Sphingobacterium lactis]|uniref:HNH endonuclease n=1 Tax=Sphingobacterium lactis TaxID=797291 RepID=A0A1H5UH92_9SPHI|nr:HNH endonuclease domain-containing protein [Sphingobacterium lactis]SEF73627.1 HNH endonuclease [Sphingobacterium lactis]
MRPISYQTVDSVIKDFNTILAKRKNKIIVNLNQLLAGKNTKYKVLYIQCIKSNIDIILVAKPDEIKRLKKEFDGITKSAIKNSKSYKSFIKKILTALEYENRRSDFYPKYFHKIGIKSCVYCNAHLTVVIEEQVKLKRKIRIDYTAKFQVDHFLPKSEYPCFSVSLYNLYPVCANCNLAKSKDTVDFNLYLDERSITPSVFEFTLANGSIAKYLTSRDLEDIQYTFSEPKVIAPNKTFQEVFKIQEIYETQKDIAEELILKAEVYTEEYKKNLKKQFPKLFTNEGIFNRLLIGNYSTDEDHHKRPMAKFTMDIAKQVGLIKKK